MSYDAYGERSIPRMMQMTEHGAKFLVEVPSLRDQFAMAALAGLLRKDKWRDPFSVADHAYTIADAMMKQREVGRGDTSGLASGGGK